MHSVERWLEIDCRGRRGRRISMTRNQVVYHLMKVGIQLYTAKYQERWTVVRPKRVTKRKEQCGEYVKKKQKRKRSGGAICTVAG